MFPTKRHFTKITFSQKVQVNVRCYFPITVGIYRDMKGILLKLTDEAQSLSPVGE